MRFDPLNIRSRFQEAQDAKVAERVKAELDRGRETQRIELLTDVMAQLESNPDYIGRLMESASGHQVEMAWRARQNFYDISGSKLPGKIDEQQRQANVKRSRQHNLYDPIYIRAISLTKDFIYGAGVPMPEPAGGKNESVAELIKTVWNDDFNRRWLSGGTAQAERCRQLLVDGEVPWFVYLDESGKNYRWRPDDCLNIVEVIEALDMAGIPMLYKRSWSDGIADQSRWYWSTDAAVVLDSAEAIEKFRTSVKKTVSDAEWKTSELEETFKSGPWVYLWAISHDPLSLRGHPPFFSALDWGEANVGLAGNLTTYVKNVTAITGAIKGKLTATDISTLKTNLASKLSLSAPPPGTGTYAAMGESVDFKFLNAPTGGGELFRLGFDVTRLMMSAGTGIPVHWLGDPETGNLATATAMQLPQIRMFLGWQKWFTGQYDEMFRICYRHSKPDTSIDSSELIDVDFPALMDEDASTMIQALAMAYNAGIIGAEQASRQVAELLKVEKVDEFVDAVHNELDRYGTDLQTLVESQPRVAYKLFRDIARKLEAK